MIINTAQFGELEVQEQDFFTFSSGIPGFEDYHRYIFIQQDEESPFIFMQCVDNSEVSLILTNPFLFYPDYDFAITDSVQEELGIQHAEDIAVWSVVSIREPLESSTLNLLAPIIVNVNNRQAKQVILHDSEYKTKHKLIMPQSVK